MTQAALDTKKYLAVHVDTTGINFEDADVSKGYEIVAICLMVCDTDFNVLDSITLYNSCVDEGALRQTSKYHNITRAVLDEKGLEEEEFVKQIVEFIIEHFFPSEESDYEFYSPIKCLGHNVATFTLPFIKSLFTKYSLSINFSINTLDTYSVLSPTVGDVTLNQMIEIFGPDPDDEEYTTTCYKCKLFINIFKQVKKLWKKKVLKS